MPKFSFLLPLLFAGIGTTAFASEFDSTVDMRSKGTTSFYVQGEINGLGAVELMVDTGSGYMTINEEMLTTLQRGDQVRYLKRLSGRLANGNLLEVPVYLIKAVNIGGDCWLKDVEAAVFPGKTRAILGLSALQRAAPFIFSVNPPQLVLSNCEGSYSEETTAEAELAALEQRS